MNVVCKDLIRNLEHICMLNPTLFLIIKQYNIIIIIPLARVAYKMIVAKTWRYMPHWRSIVSVKKIKV